MVTKTLVNLSGSEEFIDMKSLLLIGAALVAFTLAVLATNPAFAQTWYNPDGSTAHAATGSMTHVRRGNTQYSYDSSGKLATRTVVRGTSRSSMTRRDTSERRLPVQTEPQSDGAPVTVIGRLTLRLSDDTTIPHRHR
jgi:YD repeat-containing protein